MVRPETFGPYYVKSLLALYKDVAFGRNNCVLARAETEGKLHHFTLELLHYPIPVTSHMALPSSSHSSTGIMVAIITHNRASDRHVGLIGTC